VGVALLELAECSFEVAFLNSAESLFENT